MSEPPIPLWLRISDIALGILAISAGIFALFFPAVSLDLFLVFVAIGLFFLGLARIIRGIFSRVLSNLKRGFSILVGIVLLLVALVTLLYPSITTIVTFWALTAALLALGLTRIIIGAFARAYPKELKYTMVGLGFTTLCLLIPVWVLIIPIGLAVTYLLGVALITAGIGRVVLGTYGFR
jgi:hypothetical protein